MPFTVKEKKFFLSPESNPGSHIAFSCNVSLVSVNLVQFFSLCLLWSCYFWRITEFFFIEYTSTWVCLMFPTRWQVTHFSQEYHRSDTVSSVHHFRGHMVSICTNIRDVNFDHLFKFLSARFLHYKTTIFPFVTDFGEGYVETMEISCFSWC